MVEGTQNQRTNLVFSEGRRIESDFNINRSVVQIEDFVVRVLGWIIFTQPIFLAAFWAHKDLSTLLSR